MADEPKKTGISELAIGLGTGAGAAAVLEPILQYVLGHPVLPDPWDKLTIGILAVGIWIARRVAKKAAA